MNSGYGATGGAKDDFGALQFGELPLADRVALLEEYHHDRWRVPREPFPSVRGILDFTSSGRRPRKGETSQNQVVLAMVCLVVMIAGTTFVCASTVPIFESLRNAIGLSSIQLAMLNGAPLFSAAVFTLPAASFTENSSLWDLLLWSSACLMVGCWVSACALMGSPLEYMLLGQWFVGLSIAVLVPAPAKLAVYWFPENGRHVMSTLWGGSLLVGIGLPFLIVPPIYGVDGHGRHLGSFLMAKAALGSALAAIVVGLRALHKENEDETAFYRCSNTKSFYASSRETFENVQLVIVLVALSLALSVGFSLYLFLPFIMSLPPMGLTPQQAGWHLCALTPAALLGFFVVRSHSLLDVDRSRRYKPAMLACIGGSASFFAILAFVLGRTGTVQITILASGFACCCAPLLHIMAEVSVDLAYPVPETTSSAVAATVVLFATSLCPLASVWLTHPMVLEYSTDAESPTGFILSFSALLWVSVLAVAFAAIVFLYEDEASRLCVETEPKVISHVTHKIAQDLRDARALSEMVIPWPERLQG